MTLLALCGVAIAQVTQSQPLANAPQARIDTTDVRAALAHVPPQERQRALSRAETWTAHAQELLARRLLAQQAEKEGLLNDPLLQARLRLARERVLAEARLERLEADLVSDSARLEAYALTLYRAQPERFRAPDRVGARHILLPATAEGKERAEQILSRLRAGANFAEQAREHSIDPGSRERGGDLGFFDPQQMVPAFRDELLKLTQPGELAGPVHSQFGWHIIRLEGRRAAGLAPFEEVRDGLMAEARSRLVRERRDALLAELMRDAVFDAEAARSAADAVRGAASQR